MQGRHRQDIHDLHIGGNSSGPSYAAILVQRWRRQHLSFGFRDTTIETFYNTGVTFVTLNYKIKVGKIATMCVETFMISILFLRRGKYWSGFWPSRLLSRG